MFTAHLVGISAILVTLRDHGALVEKELLSVCETYGLRAGSIVWSRALERAVKFGLVDREDKFSLSDLGNEMCVLQGTELEPTDTFTQAITVMALAQAKERPLVATTDLTGTSINDPRGTAREVLATLGAAGVVTTTGQGWGLVKTGFEPLLIGLMMGRPGGSPLAQETGRIGEQLTLRYFRELQWRALHVSETSDQFGFDIFLRPAGNATDDPRAIEAKATTGVGELTMYLSPHELKVAARLGDQYSVILWGEVRLTESVGENYTRLRESGYPLEFRDPVRILKQVHPGLFDGIGAPFGRVHPEGLRLVVRHP